MPTWKRKALGLSAAVVLTAASPPGAGAATATATPLEAAAAATTPTTVQTVPATATGGAPVTLPDPASAAILVDVDTGRALYEYNAHQPLPPGSLTKTLTAMIAVNWLPANAQVPVTPVAFNVYPDKVGMKPGQNWPLDITMHALITDSANDAAYALAVDIGGGSLAGFVPILDGAAAQIGMSDHPTLEDPAGLDYSEGFNGGNRISAWDLSIMGRDMMAVPQLAAIAGLRTFDFEGPDGIAYHLRSLNYHFLATYPGAIGVKTGFTDAAGLCDTEEAVQNGRHMLAVVLHSENPDADTAALITAGFSVPVTAEDGAPQLPAIKQPEPAPPTPPATTTTEAARRGPGTEAAALTDPARTDHTRNIVLDAAAVAIVGIGTAVWWRGFRRRSRYRPSHARPPAGD